MGKDKRTLYGVWQKCSASEPMNCDIIIKKLQTLTKCILWTRLCARCRCLYSLLIFDIHSVLFSAVGFFALHSNVLIYLLSALFSFSIFWLIATSSQRLSFTSASVAFSVFSVLFAGLTHKHIYPQEGPQAWEFFEGSNRNCLLWVMPFVSEKSCWSIWHVVTSHLLISWKVFTEYVLRHRVHCHCDIISD